MDGKESLQATQEALDVAQGALSEAVRARDAAIRAAQANGTPVASIAETLGVDRQIVYRILRRA